MISSLAFSSLQGLRGTHKGKHMGQENKHKHLELISQAIARMAQNSFAVRNWCIAVISAIVALSVETQNQWLAVSALLPLFVFLLIDTYYLNQERGFRHLYDEVRSKSDEEIDFIMTPSKREGFRKVVRRPILGLLYGGLAITIMGVSAALWIQGNSAEEEHPHATQNT